MHEHKPTPTAQELEEIRLELEREALLRRTEVGVDPITPIQESPQEEDVPTHTIPDERHESPDRVIDREKLAA